MHSFSGCYSGTFIECDGIIDGHANHNSSIFCPIKSLVIVFRVKFSIINERYLSRLFQSNVIFHQTFEMRFINWKFTRDTFQRIWKCVITSTNRQRIETSRPKVDLTSFKFLHGIHKISELFWNIRQYQSCILRFILGFHSVHVIQTFVHYYENNFQCSFWLYMYQNTVLNDSAFIWNVSSWQRAD